MPNVEFEATEAERAVFAPVRRALFPSMDGEKGPWSGVPDRRRRIRALIRRLARTPQPLSKPSAAQLVGETWYPSLAELPWVPEWLDRVLDETRHLPKGGRLSDVREVVAYGWRPAIQLADLRTQPPTEVRFESGANRTLSKANAQQALTAALRRIFKEESHETDFEQWRAESELAAIAGARLRTLIAKLHNGSPYRADPGPQIRSDVAVWALVRLDGVVPSKLAAWAQALDEAPSEPGRGPRQPFPTTDRRYRQIVGEATKLLIAR